MTINQLSIFIENKSGALIKVLDLLSKEGVQIIASTIADTSEFGIYRVICNEPIKAYNVLKNNNINVQLTDVLAVEIEDEPGKAAHVIDLFTKAGVNVAYMYSFLFKGKGVLILKVNPLEKAKEIMMLDKIGFITVEDLR